MDIIDACLSLTPVPYLTAAFSAFRVLCAAIGHDQWNLQLRALADSIAQLLQILDGEARTGHVKSPKVDALHTLIREIVSFVETTHSRDFIRLLFTKHERITTVEAFHRRLCSCAEALQVPAQIQVWRRWNVAARAADRHLIDTCLTELETDRLKLRQVLNLSQHNMMAVMMSLQKFTTKRLCSEREHQFISSTLDYLTTVTGEHVAEIDSWMITTYDVEFGPAMGSDEFGQLFKGIWNGSLVALKVMKTQSGATPSLGVIRREMGTLSTLSHPHILQYLGANAFDDRPFFMMPFLKNGNVTDYIYNNPKCNRIMILLHVSLGLAYLHDNNVIHGDLRALNVLIDDDGCAVLCDYGLSRIKSDATRFMGQGTTSVVGNRNWMSPERLLGGAMRKSVDVYAFGMTMFEILTGEIPLGHLAHADFIQLVVNLNARPERPDDDLPFKIPDGIWSLAEACWVKTPQDRPSASVVCDTISRTLKMTVRALPPTPPLPAPLPASLPPPLSTSDLTSRGPLSPIESILSPSFFPATLDISSDSSLSFSFSTSSLVSDHSSVMGLSKTENAGVVENSPVIAGSVPIPSPGGTVDILGPEDVKNSPLPSTPQDTSSIATPASSQSKQFAYSPLPDAMPTPRDTPEHTPPGTQHRQKQSRFPNVSRWFRSQQQGTPVSPFDNTTSGYSTPNSDFLSPAMNSFSPISQPSSAHSSGSSIRSGSGIGTPQMSVISIGSEPPSAGSGRLSAKDVHSGAMSSQSLIGSIAEGGSGKQARFPRANGWFRDQQNKSTTSLPLSSPLRFAYSGQSAPSAGDDMWSLDELLDRWITRSPDIAKDEEFQDLFLTTYKAFTNSKVVFDGLCLRFDATSSNDEPAQYRAAKRHSIISAINCWVTGSHIPSEPEVLAKVREFAKSISSSPFLGEKARQIAGAVDRKVEKHPFPSISNSGPTTRTLLANAPEHMAAALTVMEGTMFSRIEPADLISHFRPFQGPNHFTDARVMNNKISFWVKQKVLRSDYVKRRGKAFKFFLKTAENCQKTRNFSSTLAIVTALESDLIQRLPETIAELDAQDQKLLTKLSNFVKSEDAYRTALNASEDPSVPILEFHLRYLSKAIPSCLPDVAGSAPKLINIMGCVALEAQIRRITKYRDPALKVAPESEELAYVLQQFESIGEVNPAAEKQLTQRSRQLRGEEAKLQDSRARALKSSGFG